eukprot:g24651.t1
MGQVLTNGSRLGCLVSADELDQKTHKGKRPGTYSWYCALLKHPRSFPKLELLFQPNLSPGLKEQDRLQKPHTVLPQTGPKPGSFRLYHADRKMK